MERDPCGTCYRMSSLFTPRSHRRCREEACCAAERGRGSARTRRYTKSPQPLRVCGLAWNSGGAGTRSVAVGLHQVLGVGELVELIDVAWATMTSMVENMSELLVGSYCVLIPCLTRPRITRSVTRSVPTRVASARPCVSNKKSARPAWQLCQALDGYSLSLPKRSINRSASNLDRIKNQAIAKQSGYVHTICANVRTPSQFVCCVDCARLRIAKFQGF